MSRCILFGLLIFLALFPIYAAETSEKETLAQFQISFVERLATAIQADDVTAIAWGAHLAGRHGFAETVPLLRTLLVRKPQAGRFLMLAVIDALIRLDAHLSDDELNHALAYGCQAAAIAFAARDPGQHQAFLRRQLDDQKLRDVCWTAVCNLLSAEKSPLLAEPLMRAMVVHLNVSICDQESSHFQMLDFSASSIGCGSMAAPDGFPPTAWFKLVDSPELGDVIVAPGTRTIYLRRTEHTESSFGIGSNDHLSQAHRNEAIAGYLAGLLSKSPLPAKVELTIGWSTPEAYMADVASERKAVENAWRSQTTELQAKKLLPETVPSDVVKIIVAVVDERSDTSKPLPLIEGVTIEERYK